MFLRKFYPLQLYVLENLVKQHLVMSNPKRFNDPFDCALLRDDSILKSLKDNEKKLLGKIRVLCLFVKDTTKKDFDEIQRYLWSFYGDSHRGFCIEIEIPDTDFRLLESDTGSLVRLNGMTTSFDLLKERLFSGEVDYHSDFINNIDTLKRTINRTDAKDILEKGIFYKDSVFERENEFRIIKYSDVANSDFDYFSIENYKKKLIFGRECPLEFKKLLENTVAPNYELYYVDESMREIKV